MSDDVRLTPDAPPVVQAARGLLRAARVATLATENGGQPHVALVTPACMPDLSIALLLSELSQHTVQLRSNPRCALLCMDPREPAGLANPQTRPRLSLACLARPDPDPALRMRYLALHPYAALYADFTDFQLWRLVVERAQFVQGFARATVLSAAALMPPPGLVTELQAAEPGVLAHCNVNHADAMALIGHAFAGAEGAWKLIGIDADGCDLMSPKAATWVSWPRPLAGAGDLHRAVLGLVANARNMSILSSSGAGAADAPPVS